MSTTSTRPVSADRLRSVAGQPSRALIVIDGSERTGRVLAYAQSLGRWSDHPEIVLLAVVRRPADERLRGYGSFKQDVIHAHLKEVIGQRALKAAARWLDHAGIAHKDRLEIGDPAETILRVAAEEHCDLIVIADGPAGSMHRWLPRVVGLSPATIAVQVAQQAGVPVTIVH